MRRFTAWLRSHPVRAGFLAVALLFLGLYLFAIVGAEWRWRSYVKEARARGVKFTLEELAPPEVPDDQNFAALPMFRDIFAGRVERPMEHPGISFPTYPEGGKMNWVGQRNYFVGNKWIATETDSPPRDILRALERLEPQFQQWSEWRTRPQIRFPLNWSPAVTMEAPHHQTLYDASELYTLRLYAHLAVGDSAAACADFEDAFQASRAFDTARGHHPGWLRKLCRGVGDGLRDHAWTEDDLKRIEERLASVSLWKSMRATFEIWRASENRVYELYVSASPSKRREIYETYSFGKPAPPIWKFYSYMPRSFFRDNQLHYNQWMDQILARLNEDATHFDPPAMVDFKPRAFSGNGSFFYYFLSESMTDCDPTELAFHTGLTQAWLDLTRVAIALERFRLATGAFPEKLEEVVPQYLLKTPVGAMSLEPVAYLRVGESYQLRSLAEDRLTRSMLPPTGPTPRDITWPYPPALPK